MPSTYATNAVKLIPSRTDTTANTPTPWTGDPFALCVADAKLFFGLVRTLPGILNPWNTWPCKELDELYPYSAQNLLCLALHLFLMVLQGFFVLSLPFMVALPIWAVGAYSAAVMGVTWGVALVLNGREGISESDVDLGPEGQEHEDECWIYLNGVSVGKHWLKGNVNRLALTFRRPIIGVHNRTYGIIFDLIQCIIERNFSYATLDIRTSYAVIKNRLLTEEYKTVILILHSQGGIEGGLILDWLLSELPHDIVNKLEIYTFGSAANHFNNPHRNSNYMLAAKSPTISCRNDKAVRHIEHYADHGDFVARWGVLSFTRMQNRYMGRVFVNPATGHLLNQHYLNAMFPLGEDKRVREDNSFMDMDVIFAGNGVDAPEGFLDHLSQNGQTVVGAEVVDIHSPVEPISRKKTEDVLAAKLANRKFKVREFSRLWCYRNGGSPDN